MYQDYKIIRVKNTFDTKFWLSAAFICVMLFLAVLVLRIISGKENCNLYRIAGIDRGVPIELRGLPGFELNQQDVTTNIKFITPRGMIEDTRGAQKCGIHKLYKSVNPLLVNPKSVIAITFAKKLNKGYGLREFILENTRNLRLMYPGQHLTIGIVHLAWDVIEAFEVMRMPYYTVVFYFDKTADRPAQSCAVFFFETPDGVWSIIWTAPRKVLENEKGNERGIFLGTIKYMMMAIFVPGSKNAILVF